MKDVPELRLEQSNDAIVRHTTSAIWGTDLDFVRDTMRAVQPGTILSHKGVGVVETVGPLVRNFKPGDRVMIPSTIGCVDPGGERSGTALFAGAGMAGGFLGPQPDKDLVASAHVNLVKLPDEIIDEQAILLSDIGPIGLAMNKHLTIKTGNCNHRRYYTTMIDLVPSGTLDPVVILTSVAPTQNAIQADHAFGKHEPGWIEVALNLMSQPAE